MNLRLLGMLFVSLATVGCFGEGALMPAGTGGQGEKGGVGGGAAAGAGRAGTGGAAGRPFNGILIVPDQNGYFDGSNAAGVIGAWWWTGDYYAVADSVNMAGFGSCPADGFSASQCSVITAPPPETTFAPDPGGRGMCASGVAAQVLPDATGQLAWSSIWGNIIGFDLNTPVTAGTIPTEPTGQYDAVVRGITGFAFDIEGDVSRLRVAFQTQGTEYDPAYWAGVTMDLSPVTGPGHYEIRWADVGGPIYLASPPPFDPRKLEAIQFQVPSSDFETRPYNFCITNTTMLTEN